MSNIKINQYARGSNPFIDLSKVKNRDNNGELNRNIYETSIGQELSQLVDEKGWDGFLDSLGLTRAQWNAWTKQSDFDGDGTTTWKEMGMAFDQLDQQDGNYNYQISSSYFQQFENTLKTTGGEDPGKPGEADFSSINKDNLEPVTSDWKYKNNVGSNGLKLKPTRLWLGKGYSETTKAVQLQLIHEGFLAAGEADGYYGSKTKAAVEKFQSHHGIGVDGIFGEQSFNKMVQQYPEFSQLFGYDEVGD